MEIIGKDMNQEIPHFESERKPEKLYRAFSVNPEELSLEIIKLDLVPGHKNEEDPTKISDGNELGVYMSTNQRMVETAYSTDRRTSGENITVPAYDSGRGVVNFIQLPVCGLSYEISTEGLEIKQPKITEVLQGVYNNGFEGEEWIADNVPAEKCKLKKISLAVAPFDREKIVVNTDGFDEQQLKEAIETIKEAYRRKKEAAFQFRAFLETLSDKDRGNKYRIDREWEKFKESLNEK